MVNKAFSIIGVSALSLTLLMGSLMPAAAQSCDPVVNYLSTGNTAYNESQYAEALAAYECAIQLDSDSPAAFNGRGNAHRLLENYEAAIGDYTQAITLNDGIAIFYNNRGWTHYLMGDFEAALSDFNQAIVLDSSLAYAYNNRGLTYAKLGDYEAAAADYAQVLSLGEEVSSDWANFNSANLPGGFEALATEIAPTEMPLSQDERLTAFIDEGNIAYNAEDYEAAITAYTNAIELDSRNGELYALRGSAHYGLNDNEATIADFDRAIELGFTDPYAFYNRGLGHYNQGNLDAALSDFNRAIEADPTYSYAYGSRGTIALEQGEYQAALDDFDMALELGSDNTLTIIARAIVLAKLDQSAEAVRVFQSWLDERGEIIDQIALAPGEVAEAQMNEGYAYRIPFSAEQGQTFSIEARGVNENKLVDPLVIILNPNGVPLVLADDSQGSLDTIIPEFEATQDGEYMLIVTHAYGGSRGLIEVSLNEAE
jgi:tetratricopeptide (TPR) repeat protein